MIKEGIWRFSRVTNISFVGDCVYGVEAIDAYDPFALYRSFEEKRDGRLPPHLVFANLQLPRRPELIRAAGKVIERKRLKMGSETPNREATLAFLATYGWPIEPTGANVPATVPNADQSLLDGGATDALWEKVLNGKRPIMPPRVTKSAGVTKCLKLDTFWQAQEEFALTERLLAAVQSGNEQQLHEIFASTICFPVGGKNKHTGQQEWPILTILRSAFRLGVPNPRGEDDWRELQNQLLKTVQLRRPDDLVVAAQDIAQREFLAKLEHVTPTLDIGEGRRFSCSWSCENLLEALYIMLFLDVEYGRRILRCEGCGILFAENKKNVDYCSDRCGNRVRVRRMTAPQ